jgi:hypothetical protein
VARRAEIYRIQSASVRTSGKETVTWFVVEWVGGEFDSDALDLDEVNTELQRLTYPEVEIRQ